MNHQSFIRYTRRNDDQMNPVLHTLLVCIMAYAATYAMAQDPSSTETIWLSSPDVSRIEQGWSEAHSDHST